MSVRVLSRVLGNFHEDSDVGDRLVLVVLADAAHDDGITWISQEEVARSTRLSERHVRRCLVELDSRGEVETRKAQRGRRRINVYRVTVAPSLPDYDRLPFDLAEPFSTTGHDVRSSDERRPDFHDHDDRTSDVVSSDPTSYRTRKGPVKGRPSSTALSRDDAGEDSSKPPKLVKVDGRDLAFDALAEVCGVDPSGNRAREVGIALNGSTRSGLAHGIRALAWTAMQEGRAGPRTPPGEEFERWLAGYIGVKAARYREAMRGAALTPLALAKWWTDLEKSGAQRDPATALAHEAMADLEAGR